MDTEFLKYFPWQLWVPFIIGFSLIPFIINVLFAVGVATDAATLQSEGVEIRFVSTLVWALATVFGGIFVVVIYWLIHRSTLRREPSYITDPADDSPYTKLNLDYDGG